MSSKETTSQEQSPLKELPKKQGAGVTVVPMRTVRRRNSFKPSRSIVKVRSLRPTKAVLGAQKGSDEE